MPTVSVCLIVKNEQEVIERCLSGVTRFADEIIIVDTGSTDDTVSICSQFTTSIYHFTWIDDFAAARNFSFSKATMDYICWLDADDVLKPEDIAALNNLKATLHKDVYYLKYDYAQNEAGDSVCTLYRERLIRNNGAYKWKYPVHEIIDCNQAPPGERVEITVTHQRTAAGYSSDRNRNIDILNKFIFTPAYENDPRIWYYLAKEYDDHGHTEKAIEAYKRSITITGGWIEDKTWAHIRIARCYHALSKHQDNVVNQPLLSACYHAKQALKLDSGLAEPCLLLGQLAYEDAMYHEAVFWFEKCLRPVPDRLSPVDPFVYSLYPYMHLVFCYDALQEYQKAALYNEKALAIKPADAGLLHNRAYFNKVLNGQFDALPVKLLNFCNGLFRKEQHINCHFVAGEHVDLICDPEQLFFYDGSIAAINEEYSLSYLPVSKTPVVLQQWYRVLAAGGKLVLREHDLAATAEKFYKSDTPEQANWYRHILYGFQTDVEKEQHLHLNRMSGFTKYEWIQLVRDAGFFIEKTEERDLYGTPSIELVAVKKQAIAQSKIGWVAGSQPVDERFPTYRIRARAIDRALNETGFNSAFVYDLSDDNLMEFHTLIFFRTINQHEYELMQRMKAYGKKVVVDMAEDLLAFEKEFPYYIPMLQLADVVICCSYKLAEKLSAFNANVHVVEDAIETTPVHNRQYENNGALTVGWIGMADNHLHAEKLRPLIEECGYTLVTIHNGNDASIKWDQAAWQSSLQPCDVAIAPADTGMQPCKSNNRVTTYMALGIPVIASPLDAYKRIIRNGINGFIAEDTSDWKACLLALKEAGLRRSIGQQGANTALRFRPKNMALKLARILLAEEYNGKATDIIIPTIYNPAHLGVCVESIIACTQSPFNIIVINNGGHPHIEAAGVQTLEADRLNYSASINLGIKHGVAPNICIMNDDVIVSDGWLEPLLKTLEEETVAFCNPLSNSEYGIQHECVMGIEEVKLLHCNNYLLDGKIYEKGSAAAGIYPSAIHSFVPDHAKRIMGLDWVAFFCTLTTRKVIETVGLPDDQFNNGSEDVDLCYRARRMGLGSRVNENSFVFHFGGTSTERYRAEDPERKEETQKLLGKKYAAPLLVIYTGFSFEPWNGLTLEKQGIGGSETAAAKLAIEFSKLGYRVVLFCDCTGMEGSYEGVEYRHHSGFRDFIDRHFIDVFIASRQINILAEPVRAEKKYFWAHDVCAMGTGLGPNDLVKKYQHQLNGLFCLSPWHKNYFATIHGISDSNIIVTQNAIDPGRFATVHAKEKNRFIYSSSPDRGLDTVLKLFPKIREQLPDATLHIYYGFDNFEKAILYSGDAAKKALYDTIKLLMNQEGVFYHGRVGQQELAAAFLKSDVWLYPTQFTETYCITALEAQMAGVLCVCSATAALSTTVGNRGILIQEDPSQPGYEQSIVQKIINMQQDVERKALLLQQAKDWASRQTWSKVAADWLSIFQNR